VTTLATITASLEALSDLLDTDDEIPEDLLDRFVEAKLAHEQKVGAYVSVIGTLRRNQAFYHERAELLKRRAKSYERLERAILDRLSFQMTNHPNLSWKSTEGDRLKLHANPETLDVKVPLDKKTVSHILTDTSIVDPKFITVSTFHCLNTEEIKTHLKAGNKVAWAELKSKGKHVRIY
jgi:hypothetical protein